METSYPLHAPVQRKNAATNIMLWVDRRQLSSPFICFLFWSYGRLGWITEINIWVLLKQNFGYLLYLYTNHVKALKQLIWYLIQVNKSTTTVLQKNSIFFNCNSNTTGPWHHSNYKLSWYCFPSMVKHIEIYTTFSSVYSAIRPTGPVSASSHTNACTDIC